MTQAGQNAVADVAARRRPAVVVPAAPPVRRAARHRRGPGRGGWPCSVGELPADGWADRLDRVAGLDGEQWAAGATAARRTGWRSGRYARTPRRRGCRDEQPRRRDHRPRTAPPPAPPARARSPPGRVPDLYVVVAMGDPAIVGHRRAVAPTSRASQADPRAAPGGGPQPRRPQRRSSSGRRTGRPGRRLPGRGRAVDAYADAVRARSRRAVVGPDHLPAPADARRLPPDGPRRASTTRTRPVRHPGPGERSWSRDPDLFWSLSFAVHADGLAAQSAASARGTPATALRTPTSPQAAASGRLWAGWGTRAPTTSTTRPGRRRCSTSTTSCATGAIFAERWGRWPMDGWLAEFERWGLVRREDGHWVRETPASSTEETTP